MSVSPDTKDLDLSQAPPVEQFDIHDEKLATRQVDAALQFLRLEDDGEEVVHVNEKKLVRKIDYLVMPLLFGAYLFQFIDKSLINYANVMGMSKDTGMSPAQFSYLATFFYVTFFVFQPLHAYLIQKFPVAKYLAVNIMLWGVIVTMHSACTDFGGLVTVRCLLGCFEAAIAPGLLVITGMWYKRAEQPVRIAIWYLGVGSGSIVGALASFGFQFYLAKQFKSWQIMYLVFGVLTIAWGIVIFLLLPDNPMTSRLTHGEKLTAIERLRENQTGIENKNFKYSQMTETLMDYQTWMIAVIIISANIPTGATGAYSSTLIKGFGYNSKKSALLNIPSGAIQMIAVIAAAWAAGRSNNRGLAIIALLVPGIIGGGLMAFLPAGTKYKGGKLAGIYMTAIFGPNLAIMYAWAAANFAGHTKKVTINAIILMSYGVSNIIGPLTFTGQTAPHYIPAKAAIMATLTLAVVLSLALRFVYVAENRKRDRAAELGGNAHVRDIEFMDLTDRQNPEFRYAL